MRTAATTLLLLVATGMACTPAPPEHPIVVAEDGAVRLPRTDVSAERVLFHTFKHDGRNVNFLVRMDGAGKIHVHLDACYSCWRYRRGFVVEGAALVCIACRLSYPIEDEVWDFIGACAPIPIAFSLDGDDLVIRRSVLERAARYF